MSSHRIASNFVFDESPFLYLRLEHFPVNAQNKNGITALHMAMQVFISATVFEFGRVFDAVS